MRSALAHPQAPMTPAVPPSVLRMRKTEPTISPPVIFLLLMCTVLQVFGLDGRSHPRGGFFGFDAADAGLQSVDRGVERDVELVTRVLHLRDLLFQCFEFGQEWVVRLRRRRL